CPALTSDLRTPLPSRHRLDAPAPGPAARASRPVAALSERGPQRPCPQFDCLAPPRASHLLLCELLPDPVINPCSWSPAFSCPPSPPCPTRATRPHFAHDK